MNGRTGGIESGNSPTALDLFSAPGGMCQGFEDAGFHVLAALDHDPWGCETLRRNLSDTKIIEGDVQRLVLSGRVDVVTGGPPCQSFSEVGRGKINHLTKSGNRQRFIDDERNRLYKEFVRIVDSAHPQFFVMENVPGIATYQEGRIVEEIRNDFEKIGYSMDLKVLIAGDFGVPQTRRRAIFIGNRLGVKNPFPEKTFEAYTGQRTLSSSPNRRLYRTIHDAISDLPPLRAGEGEDEMKYSRPPVTEYQKWARRGSQRLYNHVARKHSNRDIEIFNALKPGQQMTDLPSHLVKLLPYPQNIFRDKIKKQRWDRPSYAIVAHLQKDGLMYVHPDPTQPRSFTPREAARIQSFQDRFRFMGPMTQQFRQIGNAVPPLLAHAIAGRIRNSIDPLTAPHVTHAVMGLQSSRSSTLMRSGTRGVYLPLPNSMRENLLCQVKSFVH